MASVSVKGDLWFDLFAFLQIAWDRFPSVGFKVSTSDNQLQEFSFG